ncbi:MULTISPECIES: flagellin N-terminal helical domain-containing protein [Bradyrhizobium]|jgi:flagellin|uniref:flagellin N-terminal helical domain-containing protein n=1 Tax=Bradyrhizobium TaxID=374 RepID=UPI000231CE0E|nr:flagellin [Bradyrhizobium japonicum]AJA62149.1 flagellar protein [Bradyrhizobium japonicum]KMK00669.1 flagellar protein [Bradyrhizobium japonicum]MCS3541453.1 flagellin-like hook-associated protein FlgL [Bradyrhizobium japonicum]MCS3991363.1 flagellin-like hook-associated protein FlgL [Bradyrhizobium japonicum]MCS4013828.1 flagellin-like hook-associated protein FlgL [Bradyrhizobium japonicum]
MSNIVLSASVRQNLLSLQSTADLLATTQGRLSTGKKVNTALDNPTNFFTAQGLDNRASDISNLLDGISNGVQVLQAANTGITSLQKLVDSAKSIASQVLQSPTGYSPKSNVTSAAIPGATANNLLGTAYTNNTVTGTVVNNDDTSGAAPITGATKLVGTAGAGSDDLGTAITNGSVLTVDGKTITFSTAQTTSTTDSFGNVTIGIGTGSTLTVQTVLSAIDGITGTGTASTISGGKLVLSTGTSQDLAISGSGNVLTALGLTAGTTARVPPPLSGKTLTIGATGGGTATSITFGAGAGQVSTLNQLNAALAANNLQATIDTTGHLNIVTSNDSASSTIGAIGGTAAASGQFFYGLIAQAPTVDPDSQATRANLVGQYNNVLAQINTTAQDSSYNGVNLLNGDTLKLVFNETGRSTLNIQGVTFNDAGLNLAPLTSGVDFLDSKSANAILTSLNSASTTLRAEASTLGSNLSIVQIRQDFSKNLINVLQTGSSSLTLADTNEEAANSQALSTRQSIAVSALSLANQSQQSVLQLLR